MDGDQTDAVVLARRRHRLRPPASRRADGTVDLFALWSDGNYRHKTISTTGVESAWNQLGGGIFASAPAATMRRAASGPGHILDVVGRKADGSIWFGSLDTNTNTWSTWYSLGGTFQSAPAIVSYFEGGLNIVARGTNNEIYQKVLNRGNWDPTWGSLGGNATSSPSITTWYDNNVEISYRANDGSIHYNGWNGRAGTWTGWTQLGANIDSAPAMLSESPGQIGYFARQNNQIIQRKFETGRWWPDWISIGNPSLRISSP